MNVIIVTTTIHVPTVLKSYIENLLKYGHGNVCFVVIGDLKTPPETRDYLESLRSQGWQIDYWDVKQQQQWLKSFSELDRLLPYNSVQRRNLGYLIAYQEGAEIIVSIDDDNYALQEHDFVGFHSLVGKTTGLRTVESSTGWFNVCDLLETQPFRRIYHRGFPYSKRWQNEEIRVGHAKGRVVVNEGLWLGTPDVDAVTHLEEPPEVIGLKGNLGGYNIALAHGTWSPFNTQNTAFHRDLLPCIYLPVMGGKVNGMRIDRYDDIWASYFIKKIADHLGDFIAFGKPCVRQKRNPHNYLYDLSRELPGMLLTEKLILTLQEIELLETTYNECYLELIQKLRKKICNSKCYTYSEKAFISELTDGMTIWLETLRRIERTARL